MTDASASMDNARKGVSHMIQQLQIPKPYASIEKELHQLQTRYNNAQLASESDASACLCRLMDISSELRMWYSSERRVRLESLVTEAGPNNPSDSEDHPPAAPS